MATFMFARRLRSPVRVDLVLNSDCNHACSHCYNPWRNKNSESLSLNESLFPHKLDYIVDELVNSRVWSVVLTGGEPLLHPKELFYAIDLLRANQISMCLNTNLTCFTDKLACQLVKEHNWDNMVLASLPSTNSDMCDRITHVSGSFNAIMKGLDVCHRNGIRVGINTVITRENFQDLANYASFINEHPVEYLSISIVIPPVYDARNEAYYLTGEDIRHIADTLLDIKGKCGIEIGSVTPLPLCLLLDADKYLSVLNTMCLAGISKCSIHIVDGRVTACAHEDNSYGNIYTDGLATCWQKMAKWNDISHLPNECQDCKWLFLCGGECRMMRRKCCMEPLYQLNNQAPILFRGKNETAFCLPEDHETLRISSSLRIRKENDGYLIRTGHLETRLSDRLWALCNYLRGMRCFTMRDIWNVINHDEQAEQILKLLFTRSIVVKE